MICVDLGGDSFVSHQRCSPHTPQRKTVSKRAHENTCGVFGSCSTTRETQAGRARGGERNRKIHDFWDLVETSNTHAVSPSLPSTSEKVRRLQEELLWRKWNVEAANQALGLLDGLLKPVPMLLAQGTCAASRVVHLRGRNFYILPPSKPPTAMLRARQSPHHPTTNLSDHRAWASFVMFVESARKVCTSREFWT